jgi:uncharacterized membrane protein YedE/YeeE
VNRLGFLFGAAFGAVITAGRMNEYNVIHNGLRLTNLYMFFAMGSAIAVSMPLLYLLRRRGWATPLGGSLDLSTSPIERKHVLGGLVFGTGWAVAGTCPAPALAMAGSGGLLGLIVVAGIFFGLHLRDVVVDRSARTAPTDSEAPERAPRVTPAGAASVVDL